MCGKENMDVVMKPSIFERFLQRPKLQHLTLRFNEVTAQNI